MALQIRYRQTGWGQAFWASILHFTDQNASFAGFNSFGYQENEDWGTFDWPEENNSGKHKTSKTWDSSKTGSKKEKEFMSNKKMISKLMLFFINILLEEIHIK